MGGGGGVHKLKRVIVPRTGIGRFLYDKFGQFGIRLYYNHDKRVDNLKFAASVLGVSVIPTYLACMYFDKSRNKGKPKASWEKTMEELGSRRLAKMDQIIAENPEPCYTFHNHQIKTIHGNDAKYGKPNELLIAPCGELPSPPLSSNEQERLEWISRAKPLLDQYQNCLKYWDTSNLDYNYKLQ